MLIGSRENEYYHDLVEMKQKLEEEILKGVHILHFKEPVLTMTDKVKAVFLYLVSGDGRRFGRYAAEGVMWRSGCISRCLSMRRRWRTKRK